MDAYQKIIINILKASIWKQKFRYDKNIIIEWPLLIKEAWEHDISSLIYYSLDRRYLKNIDIEILEQWKKEIFIANLIQRNNINYILNIVNGLKKHGIEIIVLKGIVLREFYPRPEFRTMGDVDILIKKNDYDKVKSYLVSIGYECIDEGKNEVHQGFTSKGKLEVEVHWNLINNKYFNGNIEEFENNLWNNSIEIDINGVNTRILSSNDFFLHMCLHMAVHAKLSGFGLRQMYDLSVFIINKYNELDWDYLIKKVEQYKILKFTQGLISLCSKLFKIEVPKKILTNAINGRQLDLLLENILRSGVHGKKEEIDDFQILCRYGTNQYHIESNLLRIIKFLFPGKSEMISRYSYAKKSYFLLPVAWMHRAFRGICVKYGVINIFRNSKKAVSLGKQRNKLIKSFEL
ncbi:nucleotidyltransferase domain-containing protein [Clostridium beijerinckii]|uniref:Nucleotidyltransferase family protein n=1 Tax=Clostridium beijerinckii TaxID=1520 RepID=A0AAX0B214_CLOBE|nr:nucleotidyltransferase family protein [Clostridium beijerinckii]MBA8936682.1 hypothetical protein [Clostridium beijerinckii]NRT89263.1 hypothetical protein [Clostridium beijerinckii]NRU40850.1 hypothetical protein [Clostridium beijerinckii]NSA95875.1 hypothetical protein [Clostridium beijerinckii]NYC74718.1 hypothetical protein [Clostridium beijerinckii]